MDKARCVFGVSWKKLVVATTTSEELYNYMDRCICYVYLRTSIKPDMLNNILTRFCTMLKYTRSVNVINT